MSEGLGAVVAYLGTCCCCCFRSESLADQLQSGSELRSRPKRDPREQAIDDEFMKRDYRRDQSGHFVSVEARPSLMGGATNSSGSGSGIGSGSGSGVKKEGLPSGSAVEVDALTRSGGAGQMRLPG